jgi:hypothetical protein
MPNSRQYRYLHKGDNEFLADASPQQDDALLKEWNEAWAEINEEAKGIKVEFTEDMYNNQEYGEMPEWINITIEDSGVLPYKMARGIVKSNAVEGLRSMVFTAHFDVDISSDWGGWAYCRLEVYADQTYITVVAKHSSEEVEINITEQFNQAIGEV